MEAGPLDAIERIAGFEYRMLQQGDIAQLPDRDKSCSICTMDYQERSLLVQTPCGHVFDIGTQPNLTSLLVQ